MQSRNVARLEPVFPVRFLQLTSKGCLTVSEARKETVLDVTEETSTILQILDRLPLGVQNALQALDDVNAMGEKECEELEMGPKRHLAGRRHETSA